MRFVVLLAFLGGDPTELIDRRLSERWRAEGIEAAPAADDYEFFRRLSLDLRGVIPEADEVRAFAANPDRARVVDQWLQGDAFARRWGRLWTEDLKMQIVKGPSLYEGLEAWIRDAARANMPYDRFVRRLLTAKGPTDLDPAAGFLASGLFFKGEGPKDVVERVSRLFLGMQVRCAECHDHPFDDWTQQDFYGMVAFFSQSVGEMRRSGQTKMMMTPGPDSWWVADDASKGELALPGSKTKEAALPLYKPTAAGPAAGEARRAAFARLLVADPQFTRAAVNRHWGMLVGRGFVHPLDGFTAARKPSHPELLDELAADFARSGYDVRRLLRGILLSQAYQRSSRGGSGERGFARARTSPLSAEQLWESLVRATGHEERPDVKGGGKNLKEAFLREFRTPVPANNEAVPAEPEATISQALYFMNGAFVAQGTSGRAARLAAILEREPDPAKRLEEIYLTALSRPPAAREREILLEHVRKHGGGREGYEDAFWALINSAEFVTRH